MATTPPSEPPSKRQKTGCAVPKQPTLLGFTGFSAHEKLASGGWRKLGKDDVVTAKPVPKSHLCAVCNKCCASPAALANHMKTHGGPARDQFTLKQMPGVKEKLSKAADDAETYKQVKFVLDDVIKQVVSTAPPSANSKAKSV